MSRARLRRQIRNASYTTARNMSSETKMDDNIDIEEGELSEEEEEDIEYLPLQRPVAPQHKAPMPVAWNPRQKMQQKPKVRLRPTLGSDSESSETEDSDEDGPAPAKRMMVQRSSSDVAPTGKKNNIWGNVIFEQSIEKDIKSFGVARKQNIVQRDVESFTFKKYDEQGKEVIEEEDEDLENDVMEESRPDDFQSLLAQMKNTRGLKRRLGKRKEKKPVDARILQPLSTSVEDSEEDIAKDVQEKLFEKNYDLVLKTIQNVGKEAVIKLFNETRDVEQEGGIKTADGSRRRTSGGVFFCLLRKDPNLPMDKVKLVFKENSKEYVNQRKKLKAQRHKERADVIRTAEKTRGELLLESVNKLAARQDLQESEMGEEGEGANVFSDATPTPVPSPVTAGNQGEEDPYDDCVTFCELEPL